MNWLAARLCRFRSAAEKEPSSRPYGTFIPFNPLIPLYALPLPFKPLMPLYALPLPFKPLYAPLCPLHPSYEFFRQNDRGVKQ